MQVPPELPLVPIPPNTEIEPLPSPPNKELLQRSAEAANNADRIDLSPEAKVFEASRVAIRDALLRSEETDSDTVADETFESFADSLYPAFIAERGTSAEAVDSFQEQVAKGIQRGASDAGERLASPPRVDTRSDERRARAVERLQNNLVSFVEAERLTERPDVDPSAP